MYILAQCVGEAGDLFSQAKHRSRSKAVFCLTISNMSVLLRDEDKLEECRVCKIRTQQYNNTIFYSNAFEYEIE